MQKASIPQSPAAPGQTGTDTGAYTEKDIAGLKVIMAQKLTEHGVESKTAQRLAPVIVASRTGNQVSAQQAELLKAMESDSNIQAAVNEVFTDRAQRNDLQTGKNATTNAISKPLEQYSAEKQSMIRSYIDAVDTNIKKFVARVKSGDLSFKRQKISDVSDRAAADIGNILGIDVSGYTNNINTNGVRHILNRHGESGEHDTTMSLDDDIARVGWVLDNYDSVEMVTENGEPVLSSEFRDKNDVPAYQVRFKKRIDGSYYVVEAACENSYKKLWVQSAYLQKNEDVTQAPAEGQVASHETNARSALASPSSDITIHQPMPGVNGEVVADEVESAEGKVLRGNTAVQIAGVVDSDSGKLQVKLTDGSTADVSELSFPENGEAELWQVVTEYAGTAEAAQTILQEYRNSDLDAYRFARGVEEGILFGSANMSPKEMNQRGNYVYMLSKAQRDMVYQIGQARGELQTQMRDQEVRVGRRMGNPSVGSGDSSLYTRVPSKVRRTGGVYYGYEGQQVDKSRLKDTQKVGVDFAERLSKKKGMTFYFFESEEQNGVRVFKNARGETVELKENGWYDPTDGSIHIDLNCGDMGSTVLYTIAHELTHFIKDMSPAKYRTLCSIVTEGYLDHGQSVQELVKNKQKEYAALGEELTWEEAYDEVIARSMEGIISDGEVMDLLDEIETRDKSLFEQIMTFLKDVARMIAETIEAYRNVKPDSPEGRMVMRMKGIHAQLQQVFAEALHDAGENFREGGKLNTNQVRESVKSIRTTEDGIKYVKLDGNIFLRADGTEMSQSEAYNTLLGKKITLEDGDVITFIKNLPRRSVYNELFKKLPGYDPGIDVKAVSQAINKNIVEVITASSVQTRNEKQRHPHIGIKDFDQREVYLADNSSSYRLELCIANLTDGTKIAYVKRFIANTNAEVAKKIKKAETTVQNRLNQPSDTSIRNPEQNVNKNSSTNSPKSLRYQKNQAAQAHVAQQNSSLEEDVQALNQLTAEQRKRGNAGKLQRSTLDAAASFLMKTAGAKGDKSQLMKILNSFYTYVGTTENTHWEDVREQALPVVRWLMDNTVHSQQRSEYAQDILNYLRGCRISLDEQQKKEVAHLYGTFGGYRNMLMGSITIANEGMSLDSQWHELSGLYPDVFDEEMTASDMPEALLDIVHRLRNEDTSALEYEYNREFIEQDLLQRVYDSYWNASTLYSVADHYEARIKELKGKHRKRMEQVYYRHRAAEINQKTAYQQKLKEAQSYYEERYQRREAEYKESRQKAVERHDQAQVRQQIRKDVEKLDGILNRGNKEKNVKLELKEFAGAALRVAKG